MKIEIQTTPNLVLPPGISLESLTAAIEEAMRRVYFDLSVGASTHTIVSSAPSADDLEEGAIILMDDGASVRRIYTKMNGSLRYVTLT